MLTIETVTTAEALTRVGRADYLEQEMHAAWNRINEAVAAGDEAERVDQCRRWNAALAEYVGMSKGVSQ